MIIGIDPGITSGYAISQGLCLTVGTFSTYKRLREILTTDCETTVVIERYLGGTWGMASAQTTQQIIGAVVCCCDQHGHTVILQTPSSRKMYLPRARQILKQHLNRVPNHAVDALAHLLQAKGPDDKFTTMEFIQE